jgi:hypothetical protein
VKFASIEASRQAFRRGLDSWVAMGETLTAGSCRPAVDAVEHPQLDRRHSNRRHGRPAIAGYNRRIGGLQAAYYRAELRRALAR